MELLLPQLLPAWSPPEQLRIFRVRSKNLYFSQILHMILIGSNACRYRYVRGESKVDNTRSAEFVEGYSFSEAQN